MIFKNELFDEVFDCRSLVKKAKLLNKLIAEYNKENKEKLSYVNNNKILINKILTNKEFQKWIQS
jgi:hypothetical protein